jgi:hypothetical protein
MVEQWSEVENYWLPRINNLFELSIVDFSR